ncbi:Hypothetical protein DEACI_0212 [Acididesulfobacillus acetoxydans]|uniref:Uncharacterized protein n=1 Tax=Acididesulfobacillus acetoxydans TaxID=1561005 RepID=A0A8S0XA90_9FIRM|nr:Hypothetical protein DEACI_0212 [Acididesulfobacillus acetoxydans]CEJ07781.1 Hypothetical protein DEACI_2247 [Acididesulfobacillus acetoxydans]
MDIRQLSSISAKIPYDADDEAGTFRASLKFDNESNSIFVLISSEGLVNPTQYPLETYKGIVNYLSIFDINIDKCLVYLDMLEYFGAHQNRIYKLGKHQLTIFC